MDLISAGVTIGASAAAGGGSAIRIAAEGAELSDNAAHNAAQFQRLKQQLSASHIGDAERVGGDVLNSATKASGLKSDPAHRMASFLSKLQLRKGVVTPIMGGDGVRRTLIQIPDVVFNGKVGIVEYIIDQNGEIVHQLFLEGGVIGAGPNRKLVGGL
jgi:hypothetical protein